MLSAEVQDRHPDAGIPFERNNTSVHFRNLQDVVLPASEKLVNASHAILRELPRPQVSTGQKYVDRVARYSISFEGFLHEQGVDQRRVLTDIIIGREEKYHPRNVPDHDKIGVEEFKAQCRDQWGPYQFHLSDEQYHTFQLIQGVLQASSNPEEAIQLIKDRAHPSLYTISYQTAAGINRTFSLFDYAMIDFTLQGVAQISFQFEERMGQSLEGSLGHTLEESEEVANFFSLITEDPTDPSKFILKHTSMQDLLSHISQFSEKDQEEFRALHTLDEVRAYISHHLPYEIFDVLVSSAATVGRMNGDLQQSLLNALDDRKMVWSGYNDFQRRLPFNTGDRSNPALTALYKQRMNELLEGQVPRSD